MTCKPRKVKKSGLWTVFGDDVLIYVHKELELAEVEHHFPARDATDPGRQRGDNVTTVFPRQGNSATDLETLAEFAPAAAEVDRIGDRLEYGLKALARS